MIRTPSVDRIEEWCHVDRDVAIKVRRILDGRDDPEIYESVQKRIRECFHRPNDVDLMLTACDELLGTCGVESLRVPGEHVDSYYGEFVAEYCNTGQSYAGTVLFDTDREVFYVTSWADFVETSERTGRYKFQ